MPHYVARHSQANSPQDAPEWIVVDDRYDESPDNQWIMSRHAFSEEAEMEAERLNGDDPTAVGDID